MKNSSYREDSQLRALPNKLTSTRLEILPAEQAEVEHVEDVAVLQQSQAEQVEDVAVLQQSQAEQVEDVAVLQQLEDEDHVSCVV